MEMNRIPEPRSALLALPRELRDIIYGYVLAITVSVKSPRRGEISSYLPLHQHTRLAILNVSKSTYEEAKTFLYRHGHFRLNALSASSPPLHENVENIQDMKMLQDITIRLDFGTAFSLGYDKFEFAGVATMLIDRFARLDPGVQRKRCVVEIELVLDAECLLGHCNPAGHFKDALGRLTGFKTVKVKIGHLQMRLGGGPEYVMPFYHALGKRLARTLGKEQGRLEERRLCLMYHPRRR